jgi:hypothetical protein
MESRPSPDVGDQLPPSVVVVVVAVADVRAFDGAR